MKHENLFSQAPSGVENMRSTSLSNINCIGPRMEPTLVSANWFSSIAPFFSLASCETDPGRIYNASPVLSSSSIANWFSLGPINAPSRPRKDSF